MDSYAQSSEFSAPRRVSSCTLRQFPYTCSGKCREVRRSRRNIQALCEKYIDDSKRSDNNVPQRPSFTLELGMVEPICPSFWQ